MGIVVKRERRAGRVAGNMDVLPSGGISRDVGLRIGGAQQQRPRPRPRVVGDIGRGTRRISYRPAGIRRFESPVDQPVGAIAALLHDGNIGVSDRRFRRRGFGQSRGYDRAA